MEYNQKTRILKLTQSDIDFMNKCQASMDYDEKETFSGSLYDTLAYADKTSKISDNQFKKAMEAMQDATTLEISGDVHEIPDNLLRGRGDGDEQKFEKITIDEGVETIGQNAFFGCTVSEIDFPDSLQEIKEFAFGRFTCPEINIPGTEENPVKMESGAFAYSNIDSINMASGNGMSWGVFEYSNVKHINFGKTKTVPSSSCEGCQFLESVMFEEGYPEGIGNSAFMNDPILCSIDLSSVKDFGRDAFRNDKKLDISAQKFENAVSFGVDTFKKCLFSDYSITLSHNYKDAPDLNRTNPMWERDLWNSISIATSTPAQYRKPASYTERFESPLRILFCDDPPEPTEDTRFDFSFENTEGISDPQEKETKSADADAYQAEVKLDGRQTDRQSENRENESQFSGPLDNMPKVGAVVHYTEWDGVTVSFTYEDYDEDNALPRDLPDVSKDMNQTPYNVEMHR